MSLISFISQSDASGQLEIENFLTFQEKVAAIFTLTPSIISRLEVLLLNRYFSRIFSWYCPWNTSIIVLLSAIKVNSVLWLIFSSQHAPGVPRILVGNRLHLAFKRQVPTEQARAYAEKNGMTFFEVSPLCNFNVIESFTELSRIVLMRHGMEKFWRPNRGELERLNTKRELNIVS